MTNPRDLTVADLRHIVLFAALVYLAITFINAIAGIILLFSLIALFTLVLNPAVSWLEKFRIPRQASAAGLAILVLGVIALGVWVIVPPAALQMAELIQDLPQYISQAQKWMASRTQVLGVNLPTLDPAQIIAWFTERAGPILTRIGTYTVGVFSGLASAFILFISIIYTLAKPRPLIEGFLRLFKPEQSVKVGTVLQQVAVQLRRWAGATLLGMFAVFTLTWLALGLILDVPFAFLFAVIAGLLEIVPIIGPILSAVPPVLVALGVDPLLAIWVVLAFIIIQQIESNLIFPLLMGGGLQLHPVSVIFAVMVMGGLFGIVGIFLAVPAAATVKVVIENIYASRSETETREITEKVEGIVSGED